MIVDRAELGGIEKEYAILDLLGETCEDMKLRDGNEGFHTVPVPPNLTTGTF